ncbi:MAG: response regulator transcription factor [Lachnospiraceae bacterium]|nr:response regulator transcription factor [Lachnospiraceae bacterium]
MAYRVVIADDEKTSRNLFEYILADSDDYVLEASFARADEAAEYINKKGADLCIMDIVMREGASGLEAARTIKRDTPGVKIILVTSNVDPNSIKEARKSRVESFWYKESSEEPLLTLMNRTMAGESIYPDTTPKIVLGNAPAADFSKREYDVLRELVMGKSNRQIAESLFISEETVKTHIQHMLEKTGYANRVELSINAALYRIVAPQAGSSENL